MDTVPIKESTLDGEEVARILVPWKEKIDEAMLRVDDKVKCKAYRVSLAIRAPYFKTKCIAC